MRTGSRRSSRSSRRSASRTTSPSRSRKTSSRRRRADAIELSAARGRVQVRARALRLGDDLLVALTGGDREHVGAVAVSQPRPETPGGRRGAPSTSVVTLLGHREDELARRSAARLAGALGVSVCVVAGVHVDAIERAEIGDVEGLADELTTELIERLRSH